MVWRLSVAVWCVTTVYSMPLSLCASHPPPGHVRAGVRARHSGVIRHRITMRNHQARANAGLGPHIGSSFWCEFQLGGGFTHPCRFSLAAASREAHSNMMFFTMTARSSSAMPAERRKCGLSCDEHVDPADGDYPRLW